ncbi:hypothetical protein EVJ58_g7977 [Rhodofomes roseus]|uniref:Uncharacterized protein n=1 Tax=Rhodofomes roseus TaxID=34475 RepID=A0A4Y9Y0H8_9APHY|nr:hypothetical protein EVJ58_g7977 [Rhodofomes roseus]
MATYDNFDDYNTGIATAVNTADDAYITVERTRTSMPQGWTKYTHPQSWAYFRNDEYKLVVDDDIRIPDILAGVNEYYLANQTSALPDGLEACMLGSVGSYFYLIIDHNQCVAEHASAKPLKDWVGSENMSGVNLLRRRRLYWNYIQGHPSHMTMPYRALTEAVDAIRAYYFDNLMHGERSFVPFSKVECDDLLQHLVDPPSVRRQWWHLSHGSSVKFIAIATQKVTDNTHSTNTAYVDGHSAARLTYQRAHPPSLAYCFVFS